MRSPNQKRRLCAALVSMAYLCCMLYLLFLRRLHNGKAARYQRYAAAHGYRKAIRDNTNLVPFRTIRRFYRAWRTSVNKHGFDLWNYSFVNNAGNILIFIPLGMLLPYFWKAQRNPLVFLLTVVLLIGCVEVGQVTMLLGCCDIDDLILNLLGAMIGFGLYHIYRRVRKCLKHRK